MDREGMRKRLIEILKEKSLQTNVQRVLTSGRTSTYYIDAKMTTLDPKGAALIARMVLDVLQSYDIDAIGGYTLGADPIVSTVAAFSAETERPLPAFIVRKEPKKHGERKMIEGPFQKGWIQRFLWSFHEGLARRQWPRSRNRCMSRPPPGARSTVCSWRSSRMSI